MNSPRDRTSLNVLLKHSGLDFYTRRVLQRWQRGELTTDSAVELLQPEAAQRLIGTWRGMQSPE